MPGLLEARAMTYDWRKDADVLRANGMSIREIATAVGMSRSIVGSHFCPSRCGCGKTKHRKNARCIDCHRAHAKWVIDRRIELVAGMWLDGWPILDIAEALGRARQTGGAGPEMQEARRRGLIGWRYSDFERDLSGTQTV